MFIIIIVIIAIKSKELWSNFIKPYYTFEMVFGFNSNPVNKILF